MEAPEPPAFNRRKPEGNTNAAGSVVARSAVTLLINFSDAAGMSFSPTTEPADGRNGSGFRLEENALDENYYGIGRQSDHESPESRLYKRNTDEFGWQSRRTL